MWLANENIGCSKVEMYAEIDDTNPIVPDKPILIPSKNNYLKAKAYFDAKDYPASANYIRKACEEELKRILPKNLRKSIEVETGNIYKEWNLQELFNRFSSYAAKNGIDMSPFTQFRTFKDTIMNPLSHDNIETQYYRQEIKNAIEFIEELKSLKIKKILTAVDIALSPMKLKIINNQGISKYFKLIIEEDLYIIQARNETNPKLSKIKCRASDNAREQTHNNTNIAINGIFRSCGYNKPTWYEPVYNQIMVDTKTSLGSLMVF